MACHGTAVGAEQPGICEEATLLSVALKSFSGAEAKFCDVFVAKPVKSMLGVMQGWMHLNELRAALQRGHEL